MAVARVESSDVQTAERTVEMQVAAKVQHWAAQMETHWVEWKACHLAVQRAF